jgi:hypothetical protein
VNELKLEIEKLSPKENDIIMVKLTKLLDIAEIENLKDISKALKKRNVALLVANEEFNFELCSKDDLEKLKAKIDAALKNA